MEFDQDSFDCVFDKGTVDALSCGDSGKRAMQLVAEVALHTTSTAACEIALHQPRVS